MRGSVAGFSACVGVAVSLAALVAVVRAQEVLEANSFRAPFDQYDGLGARVIESWRYGASATVNQNFIRLTPDRQSHRGFLWNTEAVPTPDWSATVRFRVSGQGRSLFGDGFAFWFTQDAMHRDGPVHGYTDTYTGFGVLFDTFRNTESGHVHKDVSLLVNDGSGGKTTDEGLVMHDGEPVGCDGDFRFHEGRDDFNIATAKSAAKISYRGGKVSVELDLRGTGEWIQCVVDEPIPLPDGWSTDAHIGITASTGQLADNHDILSVQVTTDDAVVPEPSIDSGVPEVAVSTTGSPKIDQALKESIAAALAPLSEKLVTLNHHVEHALTQVRDNNEHSLKKIKAQEEDMLRRIEELEVALQERMNSAVKETVDESLQEQMERRVATLEERVDRTLKKRIATDVAARIDGVEDMVESVGGGWVWPFIALVVILLCAFGAFFKKYESDKKRHIL